MPEAQLSPDVQCPLCTGRDVRLLEKVRYSEIRALYARLYGMEISLGAHQEVSYAQCCSCDLRFFHPMICGDGAFYEDLQRFSWYYLESKPEFAMAAKYINENDSVLEVGCGEGNFYASLPPGCKYHGIEFNDKAIKKAVARGLFVEKQLVQDLVPTAAGRYTVVTTFQVLEHVSDPADFLRAMSQLLAPGGKLIVSVPSEDSFMADEVNNVFNVPPHHVTRWSDAALEKVASLTGLTMRTIVHESLGSSHVRAAAHAMLFGFAKRKLGVRLPLVSLPMCGMVMRSLTSLLALPCELYLRVARKRARGHSVVAVYSKEPDLAGPYL